jgi:hypothetical protein
MHVAEKNKKYLEKIGVVKIAKSYSEDVSHAEPD